MGREYQRDTAVSRAKPDGKDTFIEDHLANWSQVHESEHLAAEWFEEVTRCHRVRVDIRSFAHGLEVLPQILGNFPVPADFITELEPARDVVV
ncbi:hypothetical protein AQ941_27730 [Burkholderia pseudomallei]|nr:hypothetical protein AQ941_27730 [Burkholderia pseudomallei]ONE00892.1 hypothetical protein AQ942_01975 [Burkholderia pseudomallei]